MDRMPTQADLVIGIDTHKHTHTAAAIEIATGRVVFELTVPANQDGYATLLAHADGLACLWAIEGAGSYGAGLARWLADRAQPVVEVERPRRPARRNGAKSDPIDAVRAAREALAQSTPSCPKQGGTRAAIAMRLAARSSAVEAASAAQRQLLGLAVTAPGPLQERLKPLSTRALIATCARLRGHPSHDVETATAIVVLRRLACRIRELETEAAEHEAALAELVASWRPDLLELCGVGPIVAATILAAWSHPGRIHSEAAFAQLSGTAPLDASSGKQIRHRLNRFGDRQLNRALHVIVITRWRHDPETRAYVERRRAQGKTDREIRRCLKRYIARKLYRQLEHGPTPMTA